MINDQKESISGPYALNEVNVMTIVPDKPGLFLLVRNNDQKFILLENTTSLVKGLRCHLPVTEADDCVKSYMPDQFLYQVFPDPLKAFNMECRWFHWLKPVCNHDHPLYYPKAKPCPVCGFAGYKNESRRR